MKIINKAINHIAVKMIEVGVSTEEDTNLVVYGMENGILIIINIFTAILLSMISKREWEVFLFLLSFAAVRIYAGGYHAEKKWICYITSTLFLGIPIVGTYVDTLMHSPVKYVFFVLSTIALFCFAPVKGGNRTYEKEEVTYFRKKTYQMIGIETVVFLLFCIFKFEKETFLISLGVSLASFLIILGKIVNKQEE